MPTKRTTPTTTTRSIERLSNSCTQVEQFIRLNYHTIGYILHGTLYVHSKRPHYIQQGEIYLLSAGWHYVEYLSPDKHPFEEVVVRLSPHNIGTLLHNLSLSFCIPTHPVGISIEPCVHAPSSHAQKLLYKSIESYIAHNTFEKCRALEHIKIQELLYLILSQEPPSPVANNLRLLSVPKVTEFENFIQSHALSRLTIDQLAHKCGMSTSNFKTVFKEIYGSSPHSWFLNQRLETICTLLRHTNDPIKNIAQECGFSTASHMIRVFRNTYGQTPTQFRLAHLKEEKHPLPQSKLWRKHTPNKSGN